MHTLKFKTNITCAGCLAKVTPLLNAAHGIDRWEIDLESEERILTIKTGQLTSDEVRAIVSKAGFTSAVKP